MPGTSAGSGGGQNYKGAHTHLWGSAAGAYVVAGVLQTHSDGAKADTKGWGQLVAHQKLALIISMLSCGCISSPPGMHTVVEVSDRNQARDMQVHS